MPISGERKLRAAMLGPKGCHLLRADTRVVERPGWYQLITPSDPSPSLNEILFSSLGDDADEVIDRTVAEYAEQNLAFKWCLGPWSQPHDLGDRLAARGFISWRARAMVCSPDLELAIPEGASVERALPDALEIYLDVTARGWEMPPAAIDHLRRALVGIPAQWFVARWRGEPAGSAATFLKDDGSAYLLAAVVLPEFRGRGIYRALLAGRLAAARDAGVDLVTTQAREQTSAPMLEHLGFETVAALTIHQRNPRD
jgi:GNAT superfamily N-acetyltransferase